MSKPLSITLILALALYHSIGQSHVQTNTLYQNPSTKTISLAFTSASTKGNLIVVHIDWDNQTRTVASVVDNNGNTYHLINGATRWNTTNYMAALYYAYNIKGGATITVTATLSGAPTSYFQIYISEFSGIAASINPLDQNEVNTGDALANGTAITSGGRTTTFSNELIYGAAIGASGTIFAGAGNNTASSADENIIEYRDVTSTGTYGAGFTANPGYWVAQMATFIATSSVLPVTLSSFTAQCQHNAVILDWTTATETDNAWFTVQGSADATTWTDIARVKGAGNSTVTQQYSYTVDQTNRLFNYFRLLQTDADSESVYSRIIGAGDCTTRATGVKIFPNPCTGSTLSGTIDGRPGEQYAVDVFDNTGKILHRGSVSQGAFQVNFPSALPPGNYYARFISQFSSYVIGFAVNH